MQVVILCGGKGTRAYPYTEYLPKPMLPIAGQPILLHVMRIYASQGFRQFILSLGQGKETILDYFDGKQLDWDVQMVDTGVETLTGGRIAKCRHLLKGPFMATYSDGLSDIRLDRLCEFHRRHGGLATVTSVPLVSQYGTLDLDKDQRIMAFHEKPTLRDHWINAGFFVFEQEVFDHWEGANLEQEVFPVLAKKGLLYAYQHDGFFKSVDTFKDQQELERLLSDGNG